MRGTLTEEQAERWKAIKRDFGRNKMMGGDDQDPIMKVTNVLAALGDKLEDIGGNISKAGERTKAVEAAPQEEKNPALDLAPYLQSLQAAIQAIADRPVKVEAPKVTVKADLGSQMPAPAATPPPASGGGAPPPQFVSSPMPDLAPYLEGLQEVIKALADRPVNMAPMPPMPSMSAPPPPSMTTAPTHQAIETTFPASAQTSELGSKVVPVLRQVAEMIRGPRSKTILLDGRLVDAFDALRDAEDLQDVLAALRPLKRNGKA